MMTSPIRAALVGALAMGSLGLSVVPACARRHHHHHHATRDEAAAQTRHGLRGREDVKIAALRDRRHHVAAVADGDADHVHRHAALCESTQVHGRPVTHCRGENAPG